MKTEVPYEYLLNSLSSKAWRRVGIKRRAGVAAPLFSIYSVRSVGIGDLSDINLLVEWCLKTGMSIIQLLPLNDIGFGFRPYDAETSFGLDPMYLSLDNVSSGEVARAFRKEIKKMRSDFAPQVGQRVDYRIKAAKLGLLRSMFDADTLNRISAFEAFARDNAFWLDDYALFKVVKKKSNEMAWEEWGWEARNREKEALSLIQEKHREDMLFHKWLQWQLFEQFCEVKKYASLRGVLLMGDLPFLVSRDSADVWAHQDYFKLEASAGAPPDMLHSLGQRWGMPPYRWENISRNHYDYVIEKLKYAQNFYDLYRIDHAVGIFRVWTIPLSEPLEHAGRCGSFVPNEETSWERHGELILAAMTQNTTMLACAEDLGTVPPCCPKTLEKFGIPGIDVQRWMRAWGKNHDFMTPASYRKNAVATLSTHDMSNCCAWWQNEAGCVDIELFERKCQEKNIPFARVKESLFDFAKSRHSRARWKQEIISRHELLRVLGKNEEEARDLIDLYEGSFNEKRKFLDFLGIEEKDEDTCDAGFVKRTLEKINTCASIFSIQLLYDWLALDSFLDEDPWSVRINTPGTLSAQNWSYRMPLSLENMMELPVNSDVRKIVEESARMP